MSCYTAVSIDQSQRLPIGTWSKLTGEGEEGNSLRRWQLCRAEPIKSQFHLVESLLTKYLGGQSLPGKLLEELGFQTETSSKLRESTGEVLALGIDKGKKREP